MKKFITQLTISAVILTMGVNATARDEEGNNFGLYRPIVIGHANLPSVGVFRIGNEYKSIRVMPGDFFKNHQVDKVHEGHFAGRTEAILSLTYGVFKDAVIIVKVPYVSTFSKGFVHPAGVTTMKLFVEGNTQAWGDASMNFKCRLWKQGEAFMSLAAAVGISVPTGKYKETFDYPTVVENEAGVKGVAFSGGPFTRFTDDGRLPAPIQPGTGGFASTLSLVGSKVLKPLSVAIHGGISTTVREKSEDLNYGNESAYYLSIVKALFAGRFLIDLTVNGNYREGDRYGGQFTHPSPNSDGSLKEMVTTDRPAFRKGNGLSFSPGLIWNVAEGYRLAFTYSHRVNSPELGPWPLSTYQIGYSYEFNK